MKRKTGRLKKGIAVLLCLLMILVPMNGDIRGLRAETVGQENALSEEEGSQSEEMNEEEQPSGEEEIQPEDSLADQEEDQSEETLPESNELETEEIYSGSDRIQPEETLPVETMETKESQEVESGEEETQPVESSEEESQPVESSEEGTQPAESSEEGTQSVESSVEETQPAESSEEGSQPAESIEAGTDENQESGMESAESTENMAESDANGENVNVENGTTGEAQQPGTSAAESAGAIVTETKVITGFEPLEKEVYELEEKPELEELLAQFPQTLEAFVEGEENGIQIPVVWECEGDYADKEVTEFWFRPVLIDEEYELGGVELPGICVVVGSKIMMMNALRGAAVATVSVNGADTEFDSLSKAVEAVNAAGGDAVLTVVNDVKLTETVTINTSGNVVLDLNGATIDEGNFQIVIKSGNVTITGDGVVDNSASEKKESAALPSIKVEGNAGLTLDGIVVKAERSAVENNGDLTIYAADIESKYYGLELVLGKKTVIGIQGANNRAVTIVAARSAVRGEKGKTYSIASSNAEIYSGTFISKGHQKADGTVYWHSSETLSIYGGEFFAIQPEGGGNYGAGLLQKAGTLQVYGGTFTGMNGIYINAVDKKKMTTELIGGSFEGEDSAIYAISNKGKYYSNIDLTIANNGEIKPNFISGKGNIIQFDPPTDKALKILISGGVFNKKPQATFLAPDLEALEPLEKGGNYVIGPQTAAVRVTKDGVDTLFDTLSDAISTLEGGETITLMKNFSLSKYLVIDNKNVTIDLNGHRCEFDSGTLYLYGGNTTLTDTSAEKSGRIVASDVGICIAYGGNVSLDTIMVKASKQAVSIGAGGEEDYGHNTFHMASGKIVADECGVAVWKNATFEMSGGIVTGNEGYGIAGNGSHDGTNILISGDAVVKSETGDCPAIFHPQEGNLTITGGTIEGGSGVQYCGAGDINISGGTLIAHAPYSEFPSKTPDEGDGSAVDGAALSLISRGDGYQDGGKAMNVNISGGEFISNNNAAISVYRLEKKGDNWFTNDKTSVSNYLGNLTVTEGKFLSGGQKPALEIDLVAKDKVAVSGGAYSSEGEWPYLISEDYVVIFEENVYKVVLKKETETTEEETTEEETTEEETPEYVPENNGSDDSDDDDDDGGTGSLTGCWIRDAKGWWFKYSNGSYLRDGWAYLYYGNRYGWYHFNKEGYMDTGWFTDLDGREYYLNPVSDGYQGIMLTGWVRIGEPWFYFHTRTGGPLGSLVKGMKTPDGYLVDEKGRWIP